jgi:hypothetical protein
MAVHISKLADTARVRGVDWAETAKKRANVEIILAATDLVAWTKSSDSPTPAGPLRD